MSVKLVIQLLGEFHITYDNLPVENFSTARLQSILAYLLLHHDIPQPRRRLAYLFWPDSSESGARNNLRQLIYQFRQVLPDPDRFLIGDTNTIGWRLDEDQAIDIIELEQALQQANTAEKQRNSDLQRYALEKIAQNFRGALLPGCYDEWITPDRERIQSQFVSALQKLVLLQEYNRDYPAAIQTGQVLLHLNPLDENLYVQLMRLHRLNYDNAGAIRIYQTACDTLEHELGIAPGPNLREAARRIEQMESIGEKLNAADTLPIQYLVGRQAEWQQLLLAWQRAVNGQAGMVIISGEAGIGKSRLAEEMLLWADKQGIITARSHTYGVEGQLTMAPVAEWLRDPQIQINVANLEIIWQIEISRLLPEFRIDHPELPKPEPINEFGQRQRFFDALARAILQSKFPTLLLIDDLQWCDQETIEWLHFLLRFDPQSPLLIVGTTRIEEINPALTRLIQQLRASVNVTEIELQPLDAPETAKLASQIVGKDLDLPAALRLYQETDGNPLFVIEMMRGGFNDLQGKVENGLKGAAGTYQTTILPPRLHAVILQRLTQLSPAARRVAEIGAVYGKPFTLELLLHAGSEPEDSLVNLLNELWQKLIIREQTANTYEFTHEKLREVAYSELSTPQHRLLHRRIAQVLEDLYKTNLEPVYGQIAVHYDRAGVPEKALPYYNLAGLAAASVYANEEAITLLKRGLELVQLLPASAKRDLLELDLLFAITPSYRITKGWTAPELGKALNRALTLCNQVGTPAQHAEILYGLQSLFVVEGRLEKVQLTYEEMSQLFLQTQGSLPKFAGLMYTGARLHMGRFIEAHKSFEEIIASHDEEEVRVLQNSQGVNYLSHGYAWNAHALWFLGLPETALKYGNQGVEIARQYAQPFNQALSVTYLAMLQELLADSAAFRTQAEEALKLTQESRAPYYQQWAQILVHFADACDQPSKSHLVRLEEAIHDFINAGVRLRMPYYLSLLARGCHQFGDDEKALKVIEEALSVAFSSHERCWDAELHRLRGEFMLSRDIKGLEDSGFDDAVSYVETAYLRSMEIAKAQQALIYELRAAIDLTRLYTSQNRSGEGKKLLAPILSRFTEGHSLPEIQSARSLLEVPD